MSTTKGISKPQKPLTEQQINMLKGNPNVAKLTKYQVMYTQKFRDYYCREYAKGRKADDIFREQGIDPVILGKSRVSAMRAFYNRFKRSFPMVEDNPNNSPYRGPKGISHSDDVVSANTLTEKSILTQLEYLKNEVDFLKKIILAAHSPKPQTPKNQPKNTK